MGEKTKFKVGSRKGILPIDFGLSSASKSAGVTESFRAPREIFPAGGNRPSHDISDGRLANKKLRTIILYIPIGEDFFCLRIHRLLFFLTCCLTSELSTG